MSQLEQLLLLQRECCAICHRHWTICAVAKHSRYEIIFLQHLYVDHDHSTGKVRGLLCNNCNTAIALLNEDPDRMESAKEYVRKHKRIEQSRSGKMSRMLHDATPDAFAALDMRTGTIVSAELFPEARKPAYKLTIDFGPELGLKRSSAQLTARYAPEELNGKQIVAVVNFPPKRIAGFMSEVLVLGVPDKNGETILLTPESPVEDGVRVY